MIKLDPVIIAAVILSSRIASRASWRAIPAEEQAVLITILSFRELISLGDLTGGVKRIPRTLKVVLVCHTVRQREVSAS